MCVSAAGREGGREGGKEGGTHMSVARVSSSTANVGFIS